MKLYVEINNEKHYIEEYIVERYGLKEGKTMPFSGLEINREYNSTLETARDRVDEAEIDKNIAETQSETDKDVNEIFNFETSTGVVGLVSKTDIEHFREDNQSNEAPAELDETTQQIVK
ncbi:MAG: hypothetical protein JRC89_08555 [Deltaproteobacteria bacterium]|nr:hypothetical protein [Deltaproteobacteria bacterium]